MMTRLFSPQGSSTNLIIHKYVRQTSSISPDTVILSGVYCSAIVDTVLTHHSTSIRMVVPKLQTSDEVPIVVVVSP